MSQKIKCAVAGVLAGAANGFFGAGGGLVLVPLLARWANIEERKAFATSVLIILPLCVISSVVYFLRTPLDLRTAAPYLAGGLLGGFFGGRVFPRIPVGILRKALGLAIIYGGIRVLL
jgi:uncharacterized membrane protein YfcA